MKSIGYSNGRLYRCSYGPYTVVVCSPDRKTAREAFWLWMSDRPGISPQDPSAITNVKIAKTIGNAPLIWAQVDVTRV